MYKDKSTKVQVNGTTYTLTSSSDTGVYEEIEVDTSSTKTVTISTVASNNRCMIDKIVFVGGSGSSSGGNNNDNDDNDDNSNDDDDDIGGSGSGTPSTELTVSSNAPTYYNSLSGLKGPQLKSSLSSLIKTTHTHVTSYNEIRDLFVDSDKDPNRSGNILEFYTKDSINGTWDSGVTYNREHVWPNSLLGSGNDEKNAGADLHHIRPSYVNLNSHRGSYPIGETTGGTPNSCGNIASGGVFEPNDDVKGDYARIFFYIMVRWDLDALTQEAVTSAAAANNYEVLREWSELDPVDDYEMRRNNEVYNIQGNRNPFIDHPEFLAIIYDSAYFGNGALL